MAGMIWDTIAGMIIGGLAVWYLSMKLTERKINEMFNELAEDPEKARKIAKILKRVLKEYKNA